MQRQRSRAGCFARVDPGTLCGSMTAVLTSSGARGVSPPWLSRGERVTSLLVGGGALGVLLTASRLEPSPFGFGTHQQLGLPACSWPSMFDIPCPSCGMTTAFAYAARGDLLTSFMTQPFGAMLALGTALAVVVGFFGAATGTRVAGLFSPIISRYGALIAVAALLLGWGYKIAEFKGLFA